MTGKFEGIYFNDSDLYKVIEGASYSLAAQPDSNLDKTLDAMIAKIAAAQQPDGYLNTYFTLAEPGKRWSDLATMHELYCAGHLFEAAVAHHRTTGKRTLLDVATFDDISIDGVFCSRSLGNADISKPLRTSLTPIWIGAPAVVGSLTIHDYHRTESLAATDDIYIASGATVRCLNLSDVTLVNRSPQSIAFLNNAGTIDVLNVVNVSVTSEGHGNARLIDDTGTIHHRNGQNDSRLMD